MLSDGRFGRVGLECENSVEHGIRDAPRQSHAQESFGRAKDFQQHQFIVGVTCAGSKRHDRGRDVIHAAAIADIGMLRLQDIDARVQHAAAWRRTLNPFWWLGKLIIWIAHAPFFLLAAAGFDSEKAERSTIGKLVSLVFAMTTFLAAVLAILDRLGFLTQLKSYLELSA